MMARLQKTLSMGIHGSSSHPPVGLPGRDHMRGGTHSPYRSKGGFPYLPQPNLEHTQMCKAFVGLITALPHHVLILGWGLHVTWDGTSPKSIHISSLPYKRWNRPMAPTF